MAQLDASIFMNQQAPDFAKAGEGFERGMRIGDMMRENKIKAAEQEKKRQIDEAYKAGQVTNPDGTTTFDQSITLGKLSGIDPRAAIEAQSQFRQQDIAKQHDEADMTFQESMKALQNPAYYQTAVKNLVDHGIVKADQVPPAFDEAFVKSAAARAGTAKDYLANQLQEQHYRNEEENRKLDRNIRISEFNDRRNDRKDTIDAKKNELSATQSKQVANYKQGLLAEQQYKKATATPDDYDPTGSGQIIDNSRWAPNMLKNNKAIEAQNATDSWIETFLREASGAAIAPSERSAYAEIYFPQPGDTEQVIKNKETARKQKMDSAALASGRKDLIEPPGMSSSQNNQKPSWAK
jgi:hypothetical protein